MSILSVADLSSGRSEGTAAGAAPQLRALPKVHHRRRGLLAGVIFLLLMALGAVLVVNIHVANNQYQVVQMQNEHETLVHQNEALSQQVQYRDSPQLLSDSAVTLGMVLPEAAGTFDLDTSSLVSGAEAASSTQRPSSYVSAPSALGADATSAVDVAEQAAGGVGGLLGAGALHTLTAPEAGQNGGGADSSDSGARTADEQGGGTIPAPKLD